MVLALALGGCAHASVPFGPVDDTGPVRAACCENPEPYPRAIVAVADAHAPVFGRAIAHAVFRPGLMALYPEAVREVMGRLQPMDLVLTRSEGRLTNKLIPGAFAHAAIYVGREADLRRQKIWEHESVVPHHAAITDGGMFIHSTYAGVHIVPPSDIFDVDDVVVLRPRSLSSTRKAQVLRHLFATIGAPFDFRADVDNTRCFTCIELVHHVLPELNLPIRTVYDRRVIIPDAVIVGALNGDLDLSFQAYARARFQGVEMAGKRTLAADILTAWNMRGAQQVAHH
jgi:hypothetical protein